MLQRVKNIQYPLHPVLSIFAMLRIRYATCVAYTMRRCEVARLVLTFGPLAPRLAQIVPNSFERNVCCARCSPPDLRLGFAMALSFSAETGGGVYAESERKHGDALDGKVPVSLLLASTFLLFAVSAAFSRLQLVGAN
jgi:hypothetical protein